MRAIRWIVVHTSATADKAGKPHDASVDEMRRYHIEHNGWKDVGYHYVVRMDGRIEYGRPLEVEGAHVAGFNAESVGVCCSGHGDLADFTPDQHVALGKLAGQLCVKLGLPPAAVIGHREADDHGAPAVTKTCPGSRVDMNVVRANVAALMPRPKPPPTLEQRVAAIEARLGIG